MMNGHPFSRQFGLIEHPAPTEEPASGFYALIAIGVSGYSMVLMYSFYVGIAIVCHMPAKAKPTSTA